MGFLYLSDYKNLLESEFTLAKIKVNLFWTRDVRVKNIIIFCNVRFEDCFD